MKRSIFFLLVITSFFAISSCSKDDIQDSLMGTTWEYEVSGKEALDYFDYPASAKASITYIVTIQFPTATKVTIFDRVKGTVYGESVNEVLETGEGTYIYDRANGVVTLCFEGCADAKITKNTLTFDVDGETIVLIKK